MKEVDLMRLVAAGEAKGVQQLLEDHYPAIYRLLRHLSRSQEDAEDLAQDVFLTARAKGSSFSGEGSLRAWLARIAVNAHSKHCRRERLQRICRIPDRRIKCEVETLLDSEWLLAGIAKLPNPQQVALILHEVHGFSVKDVAEFTGCPEGTVKARLHYARATLQQILICPDEEAHNVK